MRKAPAILNELGNISKTLSEMPDKPVFSVPDGYFKRFPELMLQKVNAMDMADAAVTDPAQEIASLSPLLAGLSRDMPMKAPEGYFHAPSAPGALVEKAVPTPVVRLPVRRFHRYAVAASVLAILGSAMLFLKISGPDKTPQAEVSVSAELPGLSETELNEFLTALPELDAGTEPVALASASLDVEGMIAEVDEKGLQEFLSEMPDLQTVKNN